MTRRLIIIMMALLAGGAILMAAGCAPAVRYTPLKPVSYEIPDAQGFWNKANDLIDKGEFGLAKLNLARAVDADRSLAENADFRADYSLVTSYFIAQEIAEGGDINE